MSTPTHHTHPLRLAFPIIAATAMSITAAMCLVATTPGCQRVKQADGTTKNELMIDDQAKQAITTVGATVGTIAGGPAGGALGTAIAGALAAILGAVAAKKHTAARSAEATAAAHAKVIAAQDQVIATLRNRPPTTP